MYKNYLCPIVFIYFIYESSEIHWTIQCYENSVHTFLFNLFICKKEVFHQNPTWHALVTKWLMRWSWPLQSKGSHFFDISGCHFCSFSFSRSYFLKDGTPIQKKSIGQKSTLIHFLTCSSWHFNCSNVLDLSNLSRFLYH